MHTDKHRWIVVGLCAIGQVGALLGQGPVTLTSRRGNVPFIGCRSDGQAGPLAAPKGKNAVVDVSGKEARELAFYTAGLDLGVLAPRGWHCFGVYGSSGEALYVTPDPVDAKTS